MLELKELNEMQRVLDNRIKERFGKGYDFGSYYAIEDKVFAFHTEMHELANEIGFFKVWKQSHEMDRGNVLEELVDVIHFLLSVGITKGYDNVVKRVEAFSLWEEYPMIELFNEVRRNDLESIGKYTLAFSLVLGIAKKLDFSEMEIEYAYHHKNKKNHERQDENY